MLFVKESHTPFFKTTKNKNPEATQSDSSQKAPVFREMDMEPSSGDIGGIS